MSLFRSFVLSVLFALGVMATMECVSYAQLATGPGQAADGFLRVGVDAYGSWNDTTFGGTGDLFNPVGPAPFTAKAVTFSNGMFLFVNGNERVVLTESTNLTNSVAAANLTRSITGPLVLSDTNGDAVNDMAVSSFTATSATTNLNFGLTQQVKTAIAGTSAYLKQTYSVTNNGASAVNLQMVRNWDADMLFESPGSFTNDEVGTTMWGAGLGPYVFQQEAATPGTTAITLSSLDATAYYGAKNTVVPSGGAPAFGFGTDTIVYDNFGVPASWVNEIANVGSGINGVSGPLPSGATDGDASVGLQFLFGLQPGESRKITLYYTYGQNTPVPEPTGLVMVLGGVLFGCLRSRHC